MKITLTTITIAVTTLLAKSQTAYDWTLEASAATFGSSFGAIEGSYGFDALISGGSVQSTVYNGTNEGPYDGNAGWMNSQNRFGSFVRSDPNSVFDLSTTGSKATIRTAYNFMGSNPEAGPLNGHALQFGLSDDGSYFGKTGTDSLFVALDMNSVTGTGNDAVFNYDLNIYDETSDNDPIDGNWNWSPLHDLTGAADGLEMQAAFGSGDPGQFHAFELTYTNIGNDKLQLDIGVAGLNVSSREASGTLLSSLVLYQGSQTIDLTASSLDLTTLRPTFGWNFNDVADSANAMNTGLNLDWENPYPTGFSAPVPEPSSLVLTLASLGLLARRKRAS